MCLHQDVKSSRLHLGGFSTTRTLFFASETVRKSEHNGDVLNDLHERHRFLVLKIFVQGVNV